MSESRKRGRSSSSSVPNATTITSPSRLAQRRGGSTAASTAPTGVGVGVVGRVESADDRIRASQLRDPKQRIKALNAILKLSSSHETNYALTGDSITDSLVSIALECIRWNEDEDEQEDTKQQQPHYPSRNRRRRRRTTTINNRTQDEEDDHVKSVRGEEEEDFQDEDDDDDRPVFSSFETWKCPPTKAMCRWVYHWRLEWEEDAKNRANSCLRLKTLEVIVAIWRNLSFVSANLRLLAYSPAVLRILVGCLYENHWMEYGAAAAAANERPNSSSSSSSNTNMESTAATEEAMKLATSRIQLQVNAMQTLIHLVPYLDVSGQKLLVDKLFYAPNINHNSNTTARGGAGAGTDGGPMVPDATRFGQTAFGDWGVGGLWLAKRLDTKEDFINCSTGDQLGELLWDFTGDYLVSVWSIFSGLAHVLTNPSSPRAVLLVALDLLQEWINQARVGMVGTVQLESSSDNNDNKKHDLSSLPTLRAIMVSLPDTVLNRLVDFLYVPRLGPDSMEYFNPVHNIVTRITTLKLLVSYDAAIDTDLRDRTLDVLVQLLELDSPRMAIRLGAMTILTSSTRVWDALVPILTSSSGRNEAPVLAAQLFRELAKTSHNRPGLYYVQSRLIELASRDARVANLVWNHLFPPGVLVVEDGDDAAATTTEHDADSEMGGIQEGSGDDHED